MAIPKDYIILIDKDTNKTVATLAWAGSEYLEVMLEAEGHKVIGKISSGSQKEAESYGDQVLR
jgi:hypothetical protein